MIYGFFGSIPGCPHNRGNHALRGNGKTLSLTFIGYLDAKRGRDVISNYKTSFSEFVPVEEIARMVVEENIRDTTILITEMQVYLNSLGVNSSDLKEFIGSVVGQSRKRNTDIHTILSAMVISTRAYECRQTAHFYRANSTAMVNRAV